MAGVSDVFGRLNLGLALWNGRDPILKERMFGLTNSEGNHGEDVKDTGGTWTPSRAARGSSGATTTPRPPSPTSI